MKNTILHNIIWWLWSQPQTLIGYIAQMLIIAFDKCTLMNYNGARLVFTGSKWGAISLGKYIFLCQEMFTKKEYETHEYGHSIQSLYLGPLYLLVIGIPSILRAFYVTINPKSATTYHNFYTEAWADALGKKFA